ncbi:hypothetical protein [Brevibacillus dissolubilis]|uniref:hypothetical protein n=1 Tax=Brevibacillus dissolubilis TaxID=1844116 RepID=UPI0011173E31|nr:hypothetical protein [Brevibacillus dissolubilis]
MIKKTGLLSLVLMTGLVGQTNAAELNSDSIEVPEGVEVPLSDDIQNNPSELPEYVKEYIKKRKKNISPEQNVITPDYTLGVTFERMGARYIYSNSPEPILGSHITNSQGGSFTTETTISSSATYVADFYHHNNSSVSGVKLGIAVKNTSSSPVTLFINEKAISSAGYTIDMAAPVEANYGKSTNYESYTINPGETRVMMSTSLTNGYIGNGKIKFSANANGLKARIYFAHPNTSNTNIFNFPQATISRYDFTSATFDNSARYAWIDANTYYPNNHTFYFSSYNQQGNSYEYEQANTSGNTVLGATDLDGNYGVEYWTGVKNAYGRTLRIYPNLTSPSSCYGGGARIALWTPANGWFTTTKITTAGNYWSMALPPADSDGYSYFGYTLPGGNCGNVRFEIR